MTLLADDIEALAVGAAVARIERSEIRELLQVARLVPHFATLNAGYKD